MGSTVPPQRVELVYLLILSVLRRIFTRKEGDKHSFVFPCVLYRRGLSLLALTESPCFRSVCLGSE